MLIQFTVRNFRSIRDEQTFSLVKGKGDEMVETHTFKPGAPATLPLLRSAAIYGPNASGKSTLLTALNTMRDIVLRSATRYQPGHELPVTPFLLDQETEKEPSEFEVTFVADKVRYQYGFSANKERVTQEWLFAFPNGRSQHWFGRVWNARNQRYTWDKGNALAGQKQLWQESTRSNALFLSTAVQLNSKQLQPIYDWFRNTLRMGGAEGWNPNFTASKCEKSEDRKLVMELLHAADLDILDLRVESEKINEKHLPDSLSEEFKQRFLADVKDTVIYNVHAVHYGNQNQFVEFDFEEESDGTQRLFAFAGPWIDVLRKGYVLFVDELNNSFHPNIVKFLVMLFHNPLINAKSAQLVFTTHDTSILDQEVFRRDQIWFCEKDVSQATKLYPLTDFSPRKGRENLEAAYLAGRYGALPFVRNFELAEED